MIRKIQFGLLKQASKLYHSTSTLKQITDEDDLSAQQINQILGLPQETKGSDLKNKNSSQMSQSSELEVNKPDFFYGLMPQHNQNYPVCKDPEEIILSETPNQNIFKMLELSDSCSFDDYTKALSKFRTQIDLYGDEKYIQPIDNNSLQFKELLDPQSKYLENARKRHMVNISIPGSIECQDPRNFMELRPIQQFRHTPLVPISQSAMKKHKQMLQRYHRKQFIFEVKTQSIVNWILISTCVGIAGFFIYTILQKEEERAVAFSRLKYQRIKGESEEKPVFRI